MNDKFNLSGLEFDRILDHKQERGKPAESITSRICEEQRIDVDAVSGATNSSIVIKKAIENALRSEAISP